MRLLTALRDLDARVRALERRLAPARRKSPGSVLPHLELRLRIIEEDALRREVEREEALRRERPDWWQQRERERRARNRAKGPLNRRLRAEGFRPVALEPSLGQKMQKLKRLEARNRAEVAAKQE
ncbi:MAG TPA: hypothetical protein VNE16_16135 [Vicinamibacterales bacterium]|nr:hypothetical protein [Vicinamibacterales bacterium]